MMTAERIIETASAAGLKLSLAPAGGLAVRPASKITPALRDLIRTAKNDLVRWFEQQAIPKEVLLLEYQLYSRLAPPPAPPAPPPEPQADPSTWRELGAAYNAHHVNCVVCQAAGRGTRYGLRCGVGSSLWISYQSSI